VATSVASDVQTYSSFAIGTDELAIQLERVREIIELSPISRVPGAPDCIRGVLSHRGQIIPIVDLHKKLFNRSVDTSASRRTCVILVEVDLDHEASVLGLQVDEVLNLREVTPSEIIVAPPIGTLVRVDYLLGLLRDENRFVSLLDVTRVLSLAELYATSEATGAPSSPVEGAPAAGS
jgi:purine-binding chemotaxis protein CheW